MDGAITVPQESGVNEPFSDRLPASAAASGLVRPTSVRVRHNSPDHEESEPRVFFSCRMCLNVRPSRPGTARRRRLTRLVLGTESPVPDGATTVPRRPRENRRLFSPSCVCIGRFIPTLPPRRRIPRQRVCAEIGEFYPSRLNESPARRRRSCLTARRRFTVSTATPTSSLRGGFCH